MADEMVRRRETLMDPAPDETPHLVTFNGMMGDGFWKVAHCNEVPPICKRELGLATSQFFSSHNDMTNTYSHLQIVQPQHTPMRNRSWDAATDSRQ